ncbi:MAG: winged helix-turn-helix domain-containing protein, partial [Woeseiaceae bacterium]
MKYTFDHFEVDTAAREIRGDGSRLDIEPRVYELLVYLIEHRDGAVGKDELQDGVWGTIVSDAAMSRAVMKLRKVLSDSDESIIRTVPRFGYRFVADITKHGTQQKKPGDSGVRRKLFVGIGISAAILVAIIVAKVELSPTPNTVDDSNDIRIAVLPFAIQGNETDEFLADGLTDELLNTLIQIPELVVTGRTSSFHFKNTTEALPEIGAALGVQYIVEGSVRSDESRIRITARLTRVSDEVNI